MSRRQKARPDPASEELRVSLFAQELGTPRPVSMARLKKQWKEMGSG